MRLVLTILTLFLLSSAALPADPFAVARGDPFKAPTKSDPFARRSCDCGCESGKQCDCKQCPNKFIVGVDPFKISTDPFSLVDARKPKKLDTCICACGCPEIPCTCESGECQCECGCKPQICTETHCTPGKACKCGHTETRPSWASDPHGEGYYLWRGELQLGYLYPSGKYRPYYNHKKGWGKLLSKPPIPAPSKNVSDMRQISPPQYFQMRSVGC